MKTYKTIFCIVACLAVLTAGTYFVLKEQDRSPAASAQAVLSADPDAHINNLIESLNMQRPAVAVKSPDFELMSINGEQHTLSRHRGKVVLLSFWATW